LTQTLDLFPIGNCAVSALIDRSGRFVWGCAPRVDSDPVFSTLLDAADPAGAGANGLWDIVVEGAVSVEQAYLRNTPILRTEITDADGARIEILDFAPRYRSSAGCFAPPPSSGWSGRWRARPG
jgi:GH15 family glucan-1,4-alpha-glucosidase